MFRHVVVFSWTDEATPEQRDAAVSALRQWGEDARRFGTLTVGVDAGLADARVHGQVRVGVAVDGDDPVAPPGQRAGQDRRDGGLPHAPLAGDPHAHAGDEQHQTMIREHIRPILGRRCAVQHEL